MGSSGKNWDQYVINAEAVARTPGFIGLKNRIVALAGDPDGAVIADIGSGTGLLALELAPVARKVWAIDISERMADYLRAKASSAELTNIETVVASAVSLPLVDNSVDVVVSNYCFHHLSDDDKVRAVEEVFRVLRPGGKFAFGDMMFSVSVVDPRDRKLIASKIRAISSRGLPGIARVAKNALLFAGGRWEKPARSEWWERALNAGGFTDVRVESLDHEGGIGFGVRPALQDSVHLARGVKESAELDAQVAARG